MSMSKRVIKKSDFVDCYKTKDALIVIVKDRRPYVCEIDSVLVEFSPIHFEITLKQGKREY